MAPTPTVDSLRQALASLGLETRGHKVALSKRLRNANANANARLSSSSSSPPPPAAPPPAPLRPRPPEEDYDSFLVFDVEATCENMQGSLQRLSFHYPNEVIEFPVVLLQWKKLSPTEDNEEEEAEWTLQVVAEFQSYVRPTWRPTLSAFCTELTGITQDQVDRAPTYPEVLTLFRDEFIKKHELFTPSNRTVWVTDGPWDLRDFIAKASYLSNVPRPPWLAGTIIDLRRMTVEYFALQGSSSSSSSSSSPPPPQPSSSSSPPTSSSSPPPSFKPTASAPPSSLSLTSVLHSLSLPPFIGREHSGLDDARNISRILIELSRRGMPLKGNRMVPEGGGTREARWNWMSSGKGGGRGVGRVEWEREREREVRRVVGVGAAGMGKGGKGGVEE